MGVRTISGTELQNYVNMTIAKQEDSFTQSDIFTKVMEQLPQDLFVDKDELLLRCKSTLSLLCATKTLEVKDGRFCFYHPSKKTETSVA